MFRILIYKSANLLGEKAISREIAFEIYSL